MNACPTQCPAMKPQDFASDQEVKWCPGCGDYSILANMKKVLARTGIDRSQTVFVSGIGCSSRFPYYVSTYGFHGIHGRAATIATGLKLARPDLSVWIITGDGDGLSIGGNHLLHLLRRNVDVKIILFNNRIYGLTKGQYSPTTPQNTRTKSSPMGVPENPVRPISVALGAEATFAARAMDADVKQLESVLEAAARHRGTAFVEVYQNCAIFNDGAYQHLTDRATRADRVLNLEHNKPLIFGAARDKGIRLRGFTPEVVSLANTPESDLLVHDQAAPDSGLAFLLSRLAYPDFPEPMGIFRAVNAPTYDGTVRTQKAEAEGRRGQGNLRDLLHAGGTWRVEAAAAGA